MKRILIAFLCLLALVAQSQETDEKKVALIIGNGNYSGVFNSLLTPVHDAEAMNWTLKSLGFKTIVGKNLSKEEMSELLRKFQDEALGADIALFFYSGHGGYTTSQKYYLVPSGKYTNSATLAADCYDFEAVEKSMKSTGAKHKLFFIDACRNYLDHTKGGFWDHTKGWIPFDPDSFKDDGGTAWYFGTSMNTVAFPGSEYSVFTEALLNHFGDNGYFDSVWPSIEKEVENQKPEMIKSNNFKDFKLNPHNYKIGRWVREGKELVDVSADPNNAEIWINKDRYGNNAKVYLKFGTEYEVEIKADGYEPKKSKISVSPSPNSRKSFKYRLTKLEPATLKVYANVDEAEVFIDGKQMGGTDQILSTLSGEHKIEVRKDGYYNEFKTLSLMPGSNTVSVNLSRRHPGFFEEPDYESRIFTYHYSPEYQIGLRYLHRSLLDDRLSFGGMLCSSVDLFSSLLKKEETRYYSGISIESSHGNTITHTDYIYDYDLDYSDNIDPEHKVKHYDVNVLGLVQMGYSLCNGITLDFGIGAAYHQDRHYIEQSYVLKKTYVTNTLTGEVSEPEYEYVEGKNSHMFKDKSKFSLALRLGSTFFVRVSDDFQIVLGGGYTSLPMNNKYSSWDACLGVCIDI